MVVPKVERKTIDDLVASLSYQTHHFPGTTLTIAVALMPDGFMVSSGFSATAHPGLIVKRPAGRWPSLKRSTMRLKRCGSLRGTG